MIKFSILFYFNVVIVILVKKIQWIQKLTNYLKQNYILEHLTDTAIIENTAKISSEGTAVLKVKNCSALASLMATYSCSDEDSEVDMQTDVAVNKEKITVAVTPKEKKYSFY